MPLLKELSQTSRDSFESGSDSKESQDVRLDSFKSGIFRFFDSIDLIFVSIRSTLRPSVVVDAMILLFLVLSVTLCLFCVRRRFGLHDQLQVRFTVKQLRPRLM